MTWNDEAEKWIELARDGHDPKPADAERVRRALVARGVIVAGGVAGTVATTAGAAASVLSVKALVVQASAALLVAGSMATATTMYFDSASNADPTRAPSNAARSATSARTNTAVSPSSAVSSDSATSTSTGARHLDPTLASGDVPGVIQGGASGKAEPVSRSSSTGLVGAGAGSPSTRRAPTASRTTDVFGNTKGASSASPPQSPMSPALEREIAGLRSAQQALHRGETESAVRALDKLEATSPQGAMLEERLATRTILACSSGHDPDALARFLVRYPASVHRERVLAACSRKAAVGRFPATESTGRDH